MMYAFAACVIVVALFLDRAWSFFRFCFLKESDGSLPIQRMKAVYLANVLIYSLSSAQAIYGTSKYEVIMTFFTIALCPVVVLSLFQLASKLTKQKNVSKRALTALFIAAGLIPPALLAAAIFSGKLFELFK